MPPNQPNHAFPNRFSSPPPNSPDHNPPSNSPDRACGSSPLCNGKDDDCDGLIDEGAGEEGPCDDGNACSKDSCGGGDGCTHEALSGTTCDDGNPCSVTDHCEAGTCVGQAVTCEDGNPCTDDLCVADKGCSFVPNDDPCTDGDPCTVGDTCKDAECHGITVACECATDSDCYELLQGQPDLCGEKLFCNKSSAPFHCTAQPGTAVVCPEPTGLDAYCLKNECVPATGLHPHP